MITVGPGSVECAPKLTQISHPDKWPSRYQNMFGVIHTQVYVAKFKWKCAKPRIRGLKYRTKISPQIRNLKLERKSIRKNLVGKIDILCMLHMKQ